MPLSQNSQKFMYLLAIVVFLGTSAWLGKKIIGSQYPDLFAKKTTIEILKSKIDIGEKMLLEDASTTFEVVNIGHHPLEIDNLQSDCDCTAVELNHTAIPPGDTAQIFVSYNKTEHAGFFQRVIQFDANTEKGAHVLIFRGKMVSPLE